MSFLATAPGRSDSGAPARVEQGPHAHNALGGTIRPCQAVPAMSSFYVAFEEYFGGCNSSGGNAQRDFTKMTFDLACG